MPIVHSSEWSLLARDRKEIMEGMTIYRVKAVTGYQDNLFKKLLKSWMAVLLVYIERSIR